MSRYPFIAAAIVAAYGMPAQAAPAGTPTLGDVLAASEIAVTGYVDTSYTYLTGAGLFTSGTPNRVYDRERNSFNLHAVDIAVAHLPKEGFGAFGQLDFGSDANVTAAAGSGGADEVDVQEAFLQYAVGPVTVIGGKFATLAGAEVIESPSNLNFSRSILFGYAIPFTHTGLRASFAVSDALKLTAGINNGWDVLKESASEGNKTLEFGVSTAPLKDLSLNAAVYYGEEPIAAGLGATDRALLDVTATYNLSDALSFALNADYGMQEDGAGTDDAKWIGLAGYANYKFAPQWRVAVRAEQFDDKDGYRTGVVQKWSEATATLAFMPTSNTELRLEGRHDRSNQTVFVEPDGNVKKSQSSIALEGIYKF